MAKTIITLSREYCTGGRYIAQSVADALGIKLYDPSYASSADRWRTEPTWRDDVALHFAVGYPF